MTQSDRQEDEDQMRNVFRRLFGGDPEEVISRIEDQIGPAAKGLRELFSMKPKKNKAEKRTNSLNQAYLAATRVAATIEIAAKTSVVRHAQEVTELMIRLIEQSREVVSCQIKEIGGAMDDRIYAMNTTSHEIKGLLQEMRAIAQEFKGIPREKLVPGHQFMSLDGKKIYVVEEWKPELAVPVASPSPDNSFATADY